MAIQCHSHLSMNVISASCELLASMVVHRMVTYKPPVAYPGGDDAAGNAADA